MAERLAAEALAVLEGEAMPQAWLCVAKLPLAVGYVVGNLAAKMPEASPAEVFEACYQLTVSAAVGADSARGLSPDEILDAINLGVAAFAKPQGSA